MYNVAQFTTFPSLLFNLLFTWHIMEKLSSERARQLAAARAARLVRAANDATVARAAIASFIQTSTSVVGTTGASHKKRKRDKEGEMNAAPVADTARVVSVPVASSVSSLHAASHVHVVASATIASTPVVASSASSVGSSSSSFPPTLSPTPAPQNSSSPMLGTPKYLMEAFESCSSFDQETFLLGVLNKREDEKKMINLRSNNGLTQCFVKLSKPRDKSNGLDRSPSYLDTKWKLFRNQPQSSNVCNAILKTIGGSEWCGAYLMTRMIGKHHKEASELGMVAAGSIVKADEEIDIMRILKKKEYPPESLAHFSQPIVMLPTSVYNQENKHTSPNATITAVDDAATVAITTTNAPVVSGVGSTGSQVKQRKLEKASDEARSWMFDYLRALKPEHKLDNYYRYDMNC
jgi:hypothetical protein